MSALNSERRLDKNSKYDTENATDLPTIDQNILSNKQLYSTIKSDDAAAAKNTEQMLDEFIEYKKERIDYKFLKLSSTLTLLGRHLDKEIDLRHNLEKECRMSRKALRQLRF